MTAVDQAIAANDAAQELAHTTIHTGYLHAGEIYTVVGELGALCHRLGQVCGHLARTLGIRLAGGGLTQDAGHPHNDPADAVALDQLFTVAAALATAGRAFDAAQQAISGTADHLPPGPLEA